MLTWTAAMGFSSTFMPEAYAENTHLYVSAEQEGAVFKAQVIEIVVSEASISELDTAYGQPDVSVNGSSIVMAQAVDGAWYAYVVDADSSNALDAYYGTSATASGGGNFGWLCGPDTELSYKNDGAAIPADLKASETQGVWIPFSHSGTGIGAGTNINGTASYSQGDTIAACTISAEAHTLGVSGNTNGTANMIMNVVREAPNLSNATTINEYGNIKLGPNMWPLIQLIDFSVDGNIDIVYNRAGADEVVNLIYTDGAEGLSFDKDVYGLKHEVGVTLTDWNLNIDPTDEDSWTFGTLPTNATLFYQLFDENGAADAYGTGSNCGTANQACRYVTAAGATGSWAIAFDGTTVGDIAPAGLLTIDRNGDTVTSDATTDAVISFQDNADQQCTAADSGLCYMKDIAADDQPVTFTEAGANTGVFINWDESLTTNMIIDVDAVRGSQAVFGYDGDSYGVLHQPAFATIEFETDGIGAEWNSGEPVNVVINDPDMNFDVRSEDEMKVYSNTTLVPAIKLGSPITMATADTVWGAGTAGVMDSGLNVQCSTDYVGTASASDTTNYTSCYEKYSERSIITHATNLDAWAAGDSLVIQHSSDTTLDTLKSLISGSNGTGAYTYLQYDLRGLANGTDNLSFAGNVTFTGTAAGGTALHYDEDSNECDEASTASRHAQFSGLVGNVLINSPDGGDGTANGGGYLCGWGTVTTTESLKIIMKFHAIATMDNYLGEVTPITVDIVSWGQSNDAMTASDRHNNAIYRLEVEEGGGGGNDSGIFGGTVEYVMLNQLNVNNTNTYNSTVTQGDELIIIVHEDLTDEDEVRISYLDYGADGVETQISDQLAAPTHSGVVEFDSDSYKETYCNRNINRRRS
jgi:hypothetical protein